MKQIYSVYIKKNFELEYGVNHYLKSANDKLRTPFLIYNHTMVLWLGSHQEEETSTKQKGLHRKVCLGEVVAWGLCIVKYVYATWQ